MARIKISTQRHTSHEKRLRPSKPSKTLKNKHPKGIQKTGRQNPRLALFGMDKKSVFHYLLWLGFCIFLIILAKLAISYTTSITEPTDELLHILHISLGSLGVGALVVGVLGLVWLLFFMPIFLIWTLLEKR